MLRLTVSILALSAPAAQADPETITDLETRFYQAFLDADGAVMADLFADDFAYQHGSGITFDKASFVDLVTSGAAVVTRADVPTLSIRDYGTTIVTYGDSRVEGDIGGDPFGGDLRFVNVWHDDGTGWRLAHRNSEFLPE